MKKVIFFIMVLYFTDTIIAQEKVGINTTNPQAQLHIIGDSVILEDGNTNESLRFAVQEFWQVIKSSNKLVINPKDENGEVVIGEYTSGSNNAILSVLSDSMGVLLPKLTTAQIANINIGMGDEGLLLYNTDTNGFEYYDGTSWSSIGGSGGTQLWTQNGSDVYYDSGNVGIGTTTPVTPLDVVGDVTLRGTRIDFKNPGSTASNFAITDNGSDIYLGANRNNADLLIQADQDIRFRTEDGTYSEKMIIKENGFVGIGTSMPNGHLDVKGNIVIDNQNNTGVLLFRDSLNANSVLFHQPGIDEFSIFNLRPTGGINLQGAGDIRFSPGSTEKFRITSNGDVGIGTITPQEKLDLIGAIKVGTTTNANPGAIRYNGDFEGHDASGWKSLTDKDDADADATNELQLLSISGQDLTLSNGGGTVTIPGGGGSSPWNTSGSDIYYNAGLVGIGTNTPSATAHIEGSSTDGGLKITRGGSSVELDLQANIAESSIGNLSDHPLRFITNNSVRVEIENNGNVGIGTTSPSEKLDVDGNIKLTGINRSIKHGNALNINSTSEDSTTVMVTPNSLSVDGKSTLFLAEDNDGTYGMGWQYDGSDNKMKLFGKSTTTLFSDLIEIERNTGDISLKGEVEIQDKIAGETVIEKIKNPGFDLYTDTTIIGNPPFQLNYYAGALKLKNTFGFGTTLRAISGEIRMSDGFDSTLVNIKTGEAGIFQGIVELSNQHGIRTIKVDGQASTGDHAHISLWNGDPAVGMNEKTIEINSNYGGSGDSRIVTDELEIKGGSDFAEHFDIIENKFIPRPGMIVSIDPKSSGKLILAEESYDRKVAGIISGANGVETGLMMGQKGSIADGDYPVALSGRVYVYANSEGGIIQPGDLLTTSSQIGQAMKVQDYTKAQGAIIGKAMTTIDENGFVLVLVNLQ